VFIYYIVAPLNAQESADVADQYYRSATIGNSQSSRFLKFGRKSGTVVGQREFGGELRSESNEFEKERN